MSRSLRSALIVLVAAAPLASFAQAPAPTPPAEPTTPTAPAKPAAPRKAGEKKISVEFRGTLRDALRTIARSGGLNLVVTGDLDEDAEVYLKDVTAAEALTTIAKAYQLHVEQTGSMWTLRPMTEAERAGTATAPPSVAFGPGFPHRGSPPGPQGVPEEEAAAGVPAMPNLPPMPAMPVLPPMPPMPALPPIAPGMSEESIEAVMREAEAFAERAEAEAEAAMERAEAQMEALQESANAEAEEHREHAEQLRERAEEMRERAHEAREQAHEAREQAREALRNVRRALNQRVGTGAVYVKEGEVVEAAVAYGGPLNIDGHVEDDAVSFGGDITLGPKAWVEGDVVSFGGAIRRAEGAVIEGDVQAFGGAVIGQAVKEGVKSARRDADEPRVDARSDRANPLASFLAWFMVLFGVGFVAALAVPARMKLIAEEVRKNPVRSGVSGFLGMVALLPLTLLLVITIIGIPVAALVLWPLALLAFAVGFTVVASEVGTRLPVLRGRKTQAVVLAIGLLLLLIAANIPVLGPILIAVLLMIGFGAIVRTRFGGRAPGGSPTSLDPNIPTATPV